MVAGCKNQGHFLSTHCFPPSSYSCLEIHICWKVPWWTGKTCSLNPNQRERKIQQIYLLCALTSDARMEPPIQALNRRSTVVLLAISFNLMLCKSQTRKSNSGERHTTNCTKEHLFSDVGNNKQHCGLNLQSIINVR